MASRRALVRSNQWWGHKVPPVIAVAAIAIGGQPGSAGGTELAELGAVLVSVTGIAAFGHLVNDWSDLDADALGAKANNMAALSPVRRARLVAATLVLGLAPWLWLPTRTIPLVALGAEVALLCAYSLPPVRLKTRGLLGALADALYAYSIPFVLVSSLFPPTDDADDPLLLGLLALWGLLMGLRGILWHQVGDLEADRRAGVETAASRIGPSHSEALVASATLPIELATGLALVVLAGQVWLGVLVAVFVAWRLFQVLLLWVPPLDLHGLVRPRERVEILGFEFVNEFVERWLPLGALVVLAANSWWWWLATAVYLVLFDSAARTFLLRDLWQIPDALERVAFSRGVRADIRAAAERRRALVAAGPAPTAGGRRGRFVFVVCGPLPHLLTLRTAIHHLRPVTDLELWLVTDTRRNQVMIDIEGLDQVVDVETPADLDDHQASIWLKTSVHRHVPPGEWCYLDSDIIASVPGVEGVFDQRAGPVAFASDLTIRENSVDRFSPWAMTCSCRGVGDEHSCPHLREQLRARFDLEVPGDWLHWNGGVFLFGTEAAEFLDLWHERAVGSFAWPEWKTRDQGALIATVWSLGLEDLPRVSPEFNFIADLGNGDLSLDVDRGWAHHPAGPWFDAKLLHLYTSLLEDPGWELGADVEAVVLRRSRVHVHRYDRSEFAARARSVTRTRVEFLARRARRVPTRLTPARLSRSLRARLGQDVSNVPIPGLAEPVAQRQSDRSRP